MPLPEPDEKVLNNFFGFHPVSSKLGSIHNQSGIVEMKQQFKSCLISLPKAENQILFMYPVNGSHA